MFDKRRYPANWSELRFRFRRAIRVATSACRSIVCFP